MRLQAEALGIWSSHGANVKFPLLNAPNARGGPDMKAVTWHGKRDVRVEDVPDPKIEEPTDAIVRITSTAICGSDLHLYEVLAPYLTPGDVLGHEPMGVVVEVGKAGVRRDPAGDRARVAPGTRQGRVVCIIGRRAVAKLRQRQQRTIGTACGGARRRRAPVRGGVRRAARRVRRRAEVSASERAAVPAPRVRAHRID